MAPVALTSEHLHIFMASLGIHLTYFYLIKTFIPSIGKDRKKLSWVFTLTTAFIVSILGPWATFGNLRTVYSADPIPIPIPIPAAAVAPPYGQDVLAHQQHGLHLDDSDRRTTTFQSKVYPEMKEHQDLVMIALDQQQQQQQQGPMDYDPPQDKLEPLSIVQSSKVHESVVSSESSSPPSPPSASWSSSSKGTTTDKSLIHDKELGPSKWSSLASSWQSILYSRWFFDLRCTPLDSWMSQVTVIFFAGYLILDMVCGFLHYRERVSLLAGWFHHSMYTGICYYTLVNGESHTFASFMIIEVPTFLLGLGFIHKSLRSDRLFGATFVLFRILWDFALTHEVIMNQPETQTFTKVILIFKSVMNFKFFIDWVKQQIRLWKQPVAAAQKERSVSVASSGTTHPPTTATTV
ncbi:MAG: hypothetical protein J3Q66DRAFT_437125 [Benniella sp.]|nr:MAG: hypothetical protein J3Q66DRAFT_437125 [Benniella sp.]